MSGLWHCTTTDGRMPDKGPPSWTNGIGRAASLRPPAQRPTRSTAPNSSLASSCRPPGQNCPLGRNCRRTPQEDKMPDEVNIDDLLEMDTDEERAKKLQGTLESCHNNIEDFTRELLEKLRGLRTEHVLRRTSPSSQRNMEQGLKVPQ